MDSLGLSWIHLDSLGFAWLQLDSLGLAWTRLDSLGLTWIHLDSHGLTWTLLDVPGLTWIHFYLLGFMMNLIHMDQGKGEASLRPKEKGTLLDQLLPSFPPSIPLRARTHKRTNEPKRFPGYGGPA